MNSAALIASEAVYGRADVRAHRESWTDAQHRAARFASWYETRGHWIHESRADAAAVWRERGINGLPSWTPAAGADLLPWLCKDGERKT